MINEKSTTKLSPIVSRSECFEPHAFLIGIALGVPNEELGSCF